MMNIEACPVCDQDHGERHWHLTLSGEAVIRVRLLYELQREIASLPGRGLDHVGLFVEKAAVLAILNPRRP